MNLIAELVNARTGRGISQSTLANRTGVSRLTITRLEAGVGSFPTLLAAMDALEFRLSGVAQADRLPAQCAKRRKQLGLSVVEVAAKANLDPRTVAALERGQGSVASLLALLNTIAPKARQARPPRASWGYDRSKVGESDKRFTPRWFLDHIYNSFGPIDLDPCSHSQSSVEAARHVGLPECGLSASWIGAKIVYINPPFSSLVRWLDRAVDAWVAKEVETIVMLVPPRTDSPTFQRRVSRHADVLFLEGRMRFDSADGLSWHAPFGLMLVVFGAREEAIECFMSLVPSVRMRPWKASPLHSPLP